LNLERQTMRTFKTIAAIAVIGVLGIIVGGCGDPAPPPDPPDPPDPFVTPLSQAQSDAHSMVVAAQRISECYDIDNCRSPLDEYALAEDAMNADIAASFPTCGIPVGYLEASHRTIMAIFDYYLSVPNPVVIIPIAQAAREGGAAAERITAVCPVE
jgi:hypothetical protein